MIFMLLFLSKIRERSSVNKMNEKKVLAKQEHKIEPNIPLRLSASLTEPR